MNSVIFRTIAPFLAALMILFSFFVLLRGHNEPGGGFIGGLIAASALAIYGIAYGAQEVRRALRVYPMSISALGLFLAAGAGIPSFFAEVPYLTGLWIEPTIFGMHLDLSTPLLFDIGVYLVVVGAIATAGLTLEEEEN